MERSLQQEGSQCPFSFKYWKIITVIPKSFNTSWTNADSNGVNAEERLPKSSAVAESTTLLVFVSQRSSEFHCI